MAIADCSRRVRVAGIDGSACFPLLFFLMYPRTTTLIFLIGVIVMLTILSRRGYPVAAILRGARSRLAANPRRIRSPWRARPFPYLGIALGVCLVTAAGTPSAHAGLHVRLADGYEFGDACPAGSSIQLAPSLGGRGGYGGPGQGQRPGYRDRIAAPPPRYVGAVPTYNVRRLPQVAPYAPRHNYTAQPEIDFVEEEQKVFVLSPDQTVAQNIERWARSEGYRVNWFPPIPPLRPTAEVSLHGPLLGATGPLQTILTRIAPNANRIAKAFPRAGEIFIISQQDSGTDIPGFTLINDFGN